MVRILFVGDVVGRPGREIIRARLPALREELGLSFVIANCENAAAGAGLTAALAAEILAAGVDAITLGDHVWDQKGFDAEIAGLESVCRPANLPRTCPGRSHLVVERGSVRLGIFTVLLRQYMAMKAECPFRAADEMLAALADSTDLIFVEAHGEASSEKIAFGRYLDGRATVVAGTHTHVPTADACVFPGGTAYLTDVGMTGPYESVLGREIRPVVDRFLDGMPRRFPVAAGDVRLSAALATVDPASRRAVSMELVTVRPE